MTTRLDEIKRDDAARDNDIPRTRPLIFLSLALVLLPPLVLLSPALRPGMVLSAADMLLGSPLLREACPEPSAAKNPLLSDTVRFFLPLRRLVSDELRAGRLPFWNPHNYCGSPLLGNSQSGVFDPLSIPYLFFKDPSQGTVWVALLRMWVAGLGAWLFARRLGVSDLPASLAGVIYGCGGFTVVWLMYPHASSSAWLPWAFLAAEGMARRPTARNAALFAVPLVMAAFGGHLEVAFFSAAGASIYLLTRVVQLHGWSRAELVRGVACLAGAGVIALLLAAPHVLPFLEALQEGSLHAARWAQKAQLEFFPTMQYDRFLLLLYPYFFGRSLPGEVDLGGAYTNYCEQSGSYGSATGVLLAVIGGLLAARGTSQRALALLGFTTFWYAILGSPLISIARLLPVLGIAPPQRSLIVPLLALAVLAATGLERLADAASKRATRCRKALLVVLLTLVAVGTTAGFWLFRGAPHATQILRVAFTYRHVQLAFTGHSELLVNHFTEIAPVLAVRFVAPWTILTTLAAVALLPLGRRRIFAAGVVVAASLDLWWFGRGYNPVVPAGQAFPHTGAMARLASIADGGRIVASPGLLGGSVAAFYGLDDLVGYDAIGRARYERFLSIASPFAPGLIGYTLLNYDNCEGVAHDLLGVRAVAASAPCAAEGLLLEKDLGGARLFRNPNAMPRAFLPEKVVAVANQRVAEETLAAPGLDLTRTAVVEDSGWPPAGVGRVQYERSAATAIKLLASMAREGVVLVTESYDPGWRATVDGKRVEILPADLALMAVVVPAGEHVVELRFRPRTWPLAVGLFGLGLTSVAVAAVPRRSARDAAVPESM